MGGHGHITFWHELGRRNVLRVAAAYAVASFAIIEVISNVTPGLHLPDWVLSLVIVLLALGFPAIVAFSWIYEITPEGVKRTDEVAPTASIAPRTGHRLNVVIVALLVVVAGLYGADRLLPPQKAAVAPAASVSIAVLPFLNLSSDKEQEFFSDGMTEEITSALAKVSGLKVVGRTSAFEFKGQNKDLRAIGQALSASHILEGSIRKDGNQIRVTAQLIKAGDGTHIWTDNYDRELKGVFAMQDEISRSIATALQIPLGLKPGGVQAANRAIDPESYQQYLHAAALHRARGTGQRPLTAAAALLDQVVAANPDYAPAWALLAQVYANLPQEDSARAEAGFRQRAEASLTKAEAAGRRAIALDPGSAASYTAAAVHRVFTRQYIEMEDLLRQALKIDPFYPEALHALSQQLGRAGRLKEALPVRERLLALEPLVPRYNSDTAGMLGLAGRGDAALALSQTLPQDVQGRAGLIARVYISMGRYKEAAEAISAARDTFSPSDIEGALVLLAQAPAAVPSARLPAISGNLSFVYEAVGAPERAAETQLEVFERALETGYAVLGGPTQYVLISPKYAAVRKTQRFKDLMRKLGRVDYWRARGWPDMCHPVGADDFACD